MYGMLTKVKKTLGGYKNFPIVTQTCYSDWKSATFPPDFPCVGKIGTASGGLGKMKIAGPSEWNDFCSIAAMQSQFFTSEGFVKCNEIFFPGIFYPFYLLYNCRGL